MNIKQSSMKREEEVQNLSIVEHYRYMCEKPSGFAQVCLLCSEQISTDRHKLSLNFDIKHGSFGVSHGILDLMTICTHCLSFMYDIDELDSKIIRW
jgi:hypothetical protein